MADALLRAYEGKDFGGRVEIVDAEAVLVPGGDGLADFGEAVGLGVAVVCGGAGGFDEAIDYGFGGGDVGVADAEGDDFDALSAFFCDDAGDFDEGVGGEFVEAGGKFHVSMFLYFVILGLFGFDVPVFHRRVKYIGLGWRPQLWIVGRWILFRKRVTRFGEVRHEIDSI